MQATNASEFPANNFASAKSTSFEVDRMATIVAKVRESLRITLASQTEEKDCFAIEFRTDDANQAEAVVQRVLRGQLCNLNDQAFVLSLVGAARAKSDLDDLKEQQANNRESGDGDSSASEWKELQAGLSLVKKQSACFSSQPRWWKRFTSKILVVVCFGLHRPLRPGRVRSRFQPV